MPFLPKQGTLERVMLDALADHPEGLTYLDLVGTGITEENIDQIAENLREGRYEPEMTDDEMLEFLGGREAGEVPVYAACDNETGRVLALCLQGHEDEEKFKREYGAFTIKLMPIAEACDQMDSEPRFS